MDAQKSVTSFSELIETHTFNRGKGSLELDIDIDAFTEDYFRGVGRRQKARYRERLEKALREEQDKRLAAQQKIEAESLAALGTEDNPYNDDSPQISPGEVPLAPASAVTPEVTLENIDEAMAAVDQIWENTAIYVEDQKLLRIDMLLGGDEAGTGVLRAWDAKHDDGTPAPLNKTTLMKFSHKAIEELWNFCKDKAKTVKKKEELDELEEMVLPESGQQGTFSRSAVG